MKRKNSIFTIFLYFLTVLYNSDHSNPVSHMGDNPFYANFKVLIPICLSILILLGLIAIVLLIRKRSKTEIIINEVKG